MKGAGLGAVKKQTFFMFYVSCFIHISFLTTLSGIRVGNVEDFSLKKTAYTKRDGDKLVKFLNLNFKVPAVVGTFSYNNQKKSPVNDTSPQVCCL